jgi:hypothetical protein
LTIEDLVAELRAKLPPVWAGTRTDELMGHSIAWATMQNKRSRDEIPNADEIFVRSGNRVLVRRDPFLAWWATTLSDARRPSVALPRRGRRWASPPAAPNVAQTSVELDLAGQHDRRRSHDPPRRRRGVRSEPAAPTAAPSGRL